MDTEATEQARGGLDRRTMIKRAAAAGAVAWTAPVILDSLASPAAAGTCTGTATPAQYVTGDDQTFMTGPGVVSFLVSAFSGGGGGMSGDAMGGAMGGDGGGYSSTRVTDLTECTTYRFDVAAGAAGSAGGGDGGDTTFTMAPSWTVKALAMNNTGGMMGEQPGIGTTLRVGGMGGDASAGTGGGGGGSGGEGSDGSSATGQPGGAGGSGSPAGFDGGAGGGSGAMGSPPPFGFGGGGGGGGLNAAGAAGGAGVVLITP
jgi:hypothetical protein